MGPWHLHYLRASCHATQDVVDLAVEVGVVSSSLMVMQYVKVTIQARLVYSFQHSLNIFNFLLFFCVVGLQKVMANLEHLKKYSTELKKAHKKTNTLEANLKKTRSSFLQTHLFLRSPSPLPWWWLLQRRRYPLPAMRWIRLKPRGDRVLMELAELQQVGPRPYVPTGFQPQLE